MTRKRVQFHSDEPSMTQQHMKDECDVNSILEKYRRTGMISHVRSSQGQYGDFSQFSSDFKSNIDAVKDAQMAFDALPAIVRKRFGNDPAALLDFVADESNREEAEKLGLVEKQPAQNQAPQINDQTTKQEPQTSPAT